MDKHFSKDSVSLLLFFNKHIKNGRAAGPDGIPSEALKVDVEATAEILLPLFRKIWEEEEIPHD